MFDGWGEDLLRSLSFRSHIREVSKKRNTQFWLIFFPLLSVECVNVKEKVPFLTSFSNSSLFVAVLLREADRRGFDNFRIDLLYNKGKQSI